MELSTRPLATLLVYLFSRMRVNPEGQFHLGIVSEPGIAVFTRTNSVTAKRIRVRNFTDLKLAFIGHRITLANSLSTNLTVVYNEHSFGSPTIRIKWFQSLRRYETELNIYSIGVY